MAELERSAASSYWLNFPLALRVVSVEEDYWRRSVPALAFRGPEELRERNVPRLSCSRRPVSLVSAL